MYFIISCREYAKYVILDGLLFVKGGDKLIVELLIMFVLKLFKAKLMIVVSMCGVLELWHTK